MINSSQIHGRPSSKEQEYLSGWQRARAELDNFRKRQAAVQIEFAEASRSQIITSLLDLADNFQAVIQHMPPELAKDAWAQGVAHVARQFEQTLEQHGVAVIQDAKTFDPALHEAIESVKNKQVSPGHILEVVQPGYKMGERVLRPAKVRVAA